MIGIHAEDCTSDALGQPLQFAPTAASLSLPKLLETCRVLDQQLQQQLPADLEPGHHRLRGPEAELERHPCLSLIQSLPSWQDHVAAMVCPPAGRGSDAAGDP